MHGDNAAMRSHPDALPQHDKAVISAAKLRDYALNPDHPKGSDKARVFAMVLGMIDTGELVPRLTSVYVKKR